jgi:hypothetical protein
MALQERHEPACRLRPVVERKLNTKYSMSVELKSVLHDPILIDGSSEMMHNAE